jgi:Ca-activated chloride channel family protein
MIASLDRRSGCWPLLVVSCAALGFAACSSQQATLAVDEELSESTVSNQPAPPPGVEEIAVHESSAGAAKVRAFTLAPSQQLRALALGYTDASTAAAQPFAGSIDREKYENFDSNPVKLVAEDPVSTFSIDVDTASYGAVRRYLQGGTLPPRDAVRVEELINYFDYDYARPERQDAPFATHVTLFPTPWNPHTQLLQIGLRGYDLVSEKRPVANLVFLVDVSGSMQDENKLPLVKQSLRLLVNELSPGDRVAMVVYAGAAGTVLEPTPGSERARILAAIDRLEAGGSTAGAEGIRQAYQLAEANFDAKAINRVLLATDGDFNVGIADPERLEDFVTEKRASGVYLTLLGFGGHNYNDLLMQKLAQAGNGHAAYVDTLREARKLFVDELGSTLFPIAQDVKVQIEFDPKAVAEYRLIGYETRLLAREDFNDDQKDAGEIGAGHRVTALYEITPVGSPARRVDPLRYAKPETSSGAPTGELAYLRLRYKLPGRSESMRIERPILASELVRGEIPQEARFAAAVAALGQRLRGDTHLGGFDFDQVLALAQGARGADPFGYRAEFVDLVRAARSAQALPSLEDSLPVSAR